MAPSAVDPTPPTTDKDESPSIPLIDFSPLVNPAASPAEKQSTSETILSAFRTYGFLYLTNHPIESSTLESVYEQSAHFFARPQSQKDELSWTTPASNRGYSGQGREKVSQGTKEEVEALRGVCEDLKESFEIGREGQEGYPNLWPDWDKEGVEFRDVMKSFFLECKGMHRALMEAIALGLGLEPSFFDNFVKVGDNTLRLLHYPPVKKDVFRKNRMQVRAGEHTDYGDITFLFQDQKGGLQVKGPKGDWLDVKPIEGTCVVNAGDLLERWSNDLIRSTLHRVVEPPAKAGIVGGDETDEYPPRYSIAYFCNPDFDKMIEALPGTWGAEKGGKKYEAVNSGDYLEMRLSATY